MRLCCKYLFLFSILTHISDAKDAPPSTPSKLSNDATNAPLSTSPKISKPTGCHSSFPSPFRDEFIFFRSATDPGFDFGIKTRHTEYYPKALGTALRSESFSINQFDSADECGWQKVKSVHAPSWGVGGKRGTIYWKYSDLQVVRDTKGKNRHWATTSPNHIPPTKAALPSNLTLSRIEYILKWNEPAADVYWTATTCLGWTCGVLIFIVLHLLFLRALEHQARAAVPASQDVELAPIVVDSTAKLTPSPEAPASVAIPRSIRCNTQEYSGSAQSDPPPRYPYGSSSLESL